MIEETKTLATYFIKVDEEAIWKSYNAVAMDTKNAYSEDIKIKPETQKLIERLNNRKI